MAKIEHATYCYLCGEALQRDDVARDHIPSRAIFSKLTDHQITLPAHRKCNLDYSEDEESFRNDISAISTSQAIWPTTVRSLSRNPGRLTDTLSRTYRDSSDGIHKLKIPKERTERVLLKYARGLHAYHTKKFVPPHFKSSIFFQPAVESIPINVIRKASFRGKFGGDFAYAGAIADDTGISLWTMCFYRSVLTFVGFTD